MDEESPRFGRLARIALIAFGLAAVAASVPFAYICLVFAGGGHGSPFDSPRPSDWVFGAAIIGLPLLLLALGVASLRCTDRSGARRMALVALLIPLDVVLVYAAMAYSEASPPARTYRMAS